MEKKPLFTIGHGSRKIEDFVALLKTFGIKYLIDVRSKPYSKFNPHFNQEELNIHLENHSIKYVFMGDNLGGRPNDPSCLNAEGKIDYEIVKKKDFFIQGIQRLNIAYGKDINVVLMCSESKPSECHRSKLIGRVLEESQISVMHIDERGKLKDQTSVIIELNKGLADVDLFGESINSTSRKSYL